MGVLRDGRFRRLLIGQSISNFGDTALYLSLGIWAKDLTGSNAAAGGVFLALTAPVLLAPLAGGVVDRVRRRPLLVVTNLLTGFAVLSLLAVESRAQLWIIYAVAVAYGLSANFLGAARSALLKDLLQSEDLASGNAMLQTATQGLRLFSPLVGAGLYATVGGGALALFVVAMFAIAAAVLASIRVQETPAPPAEPVRRDFLIGFGHIMRTAILKQVTIAAAVAFGVIGFYESVAFAIIETGLHRSPSFYGVLTSVQGAGAIIGGLTASQLSRRFGDARLVGLSLVAFAVAHMAFTASAAPLVFAAAVIIGLAMPWFLVGFNTAIQRYTPATMQGRVNAVSYQFILIPQTASIALGAALITRVDYRVLLVVVAVILSVGAAVLLSRPAAPPAGDEDSATRRSTPDGATSQR